MIKASPDEIIFTSGATESNNMAFSGALRAMRGKGRIIVSAVEHPSVYETALTYKSAGYDVVLPKWMAMAASGLIRSASLLHKTLSL